MPVQRFWPAITLVIFLNGCAKIPPHSLDPEITLQEIENRRLDSQELRTYFESKLGMCELWPIHNWDFRHLELVAWRYNPEIEIAKAQVQAAEAGIVTAKMRRNPIMPFAPSYDTQTSFGALNPGFPPWTIIWALQFYVTDFLFRKHLIHEAENKSLAARVSYFQTTWNLSNSLKQTLSNILYDEKNIELIEEKICLMNELLQLAEGRLQLGDITKFELRGLEITQLQLEMDLDNAIEILQTNKITLARYLGISEEAVREIQIDYPFHDHIAYDTDLPSLRRQALTHRADILASLYNFAAAQSALQVELGKQIKDVQLGPGFEYDNGVYRWGFFDLTMPVPLFNLNEGPIAQALAQRELAAANFLNLQSTLLGQIDQAIVSYQISRKQFDEASSFLEKSQNNLENAKAQFQLGDFSRFDLLNAKLQMNAAKTAFLNAQKKLQTSLVTLEGVIQYPILDEESATCVY